MLKPNGVVGRVITKQLFLCAACRNIPVFDPEKFLFNGKVLVFVGEVKEPYLPRGKKNKDNIAHITQKLEPLGCCPYYTLNAVWLFFYIRKISQRI